VVRGPWTLAWIRFRRDKVAVVAGLVVLAIVLFALCAPLLAAVTGHPPDQQFRGPEALSPQGLPVGPNAQFWLGTDDLGRDLLVRIAYGARISLVVGAASAIGAVAVGALLGLLGGLFGGLVDSAVSGLIDLVLSVPFMLVAIALVSVTGPSLLLTIAVISAFSWAAVARVVRGQVKSLREREFVEAARALGARPLRIMVVDLLPNVLPQLIVYSTLILPVAIIAQASLAYLGLGLPPPTADWGGMLSSGQKYYQTSWWYIAFPGLALLTTTVALNLVGDGVRDAFDPRGTARRKRGAA
jgi:peptide/nickel transport system permease protein